MPPAMWSRNHETSGPGPGDRNSPGYAGRLDREQGPGRALLPMPCRSVLASAFHEGVVAVVWAAVGWCEWRPGRLGGRAGVVLALLYRPWAAAGGWVGMAA
jgi:hypothetical protein